MSQNKSPFVNLVLSITSTCCNKRQELSGNFNVNGVQRVNDHSEKNNDKVELEKSESIDQIIESVVEEPQV